MLRRGEEKDAGRILAAAGAHLVAGREVEDSVVDRPAAAALAVSVADRLAAAEQEEAGDFCRRPN